jgi:hypothetical protein
MSIAFHPALHRVLLLLTCLAVGAPGLADEDGILLRYDFEGVGPATGPYTLMVFEDSSGSVAVTTTYRYGGYRAVEIRDVAGDGNFAELQGYFPDITAGKLFAGFAFMTATPDETFNIALAGRSHFTMTRDGIGFWLTGERGTLHHVTGGEAIPLFALEVFTWYVVELVYDVDRGVYDLTVHQEGLDEPIVALTDRPNAVGQSGSGLRMFSFIGDRPGIDRSDVRFYVDDIVVGTDSAISVPNFIAPGRRMLFVDIWDHYRARMLERPECPPVLNHADFDLSPVELQQLAELGLLETFDALADGRETSSWKTIDDPQLRRLLQAMALWGQGCRLLRDQPQAALKIFDAAEARASQAKLYAMSRVLALAGAELWSEADELFMAIYADWHDDPRFPAVSAALGLARGNLEQTESWLVTSIERTPERLDHPAIRQLWSGRIDRQLVRALRESFEEDWAGYVSTALTAEQRYYVLLWRQRYDEAALYASRMTELFRAMELPAGRWLERQGDALFYDADYEGARNSFETSLAEQGERTPLLLKLSDVHYKLGDPELERAYREKVYGSLDSEDDRLQPATIHAPGLDRGGRESCPCTGSGVPEHLKHGSNRKESDRTVVLHDR